MEKRISHFYSRAAKHARTGPRPLSFDELGEAASAVAEAAVAPSAVATAGTAAEVAETAVEAVVGARLVTREAMETAVEVAETAAEAVVGAGLVTGEAVETTVEADSGSSSSFSYEDSEEESEETVLETRPEVGLDEVGPAEVLEARPVDPSLRNLVRTTAGGGTWSTLFDGRRRVM